MDKVSKGWIYGFIGVAVFSGSLPATRMAVADFDPLFLTNARAAIAGLLAVGLLLFVPQKASGSGSKTHSSTHIRTRPGKSDILSLIIVALGVVVGFPLLTALALQHITSAHSIVFIGLLPLATAIFGVLRGDDNPPLLFWLFSVLGGSLVAGYALSQDHSLNWTGDLLMFAAIIVCGWGYAEGGKLSRKLGGWQVISWALVVSLPLMAPLTLFTIPESFATVGFDAWLALAYVSLFSMLIGFVFWYRGLAEGGITAVSQLQLLQPFMGFVLAATFLGEEISWSMAAVSLAVVACVAGARNVSAERSSANKAVTTDTPVKSTNQKAL